MATLSDISWIFLGIISAFYAVLALKSVLKLSVCSICAAVSLSWLSLLVLRLLGQFENDVLLALLLGMSVVGGYYLWERRARDAMLLFRLPVLLTLAAAAWTLVSWQLDIWLVVIVTALWAMHGALYTYRTNDNLKPKIDKIIACCSSW